MNEIVKFLIRRSRRPVAFPWAFPPQTCLMAKKSSGFFPKNAAEPEVELAVARESRTARPGGFFRRHDLAKLLRYLC